MKPTTPTPPHRKARARAVAARVNGRVKYIGYGLLVLLLVLLAQLTLTAQTITPTTTKLDKIDNARVISMEVDMERDIVVDIWKQYLDDKYDIELDRIDRSRNQETFRSESSKVTKLSAIPARLYAKVYESGDNRSTVYLSASTGGERMITESTHPLEYERMMAMLRGFHPYIYETYYGRQMDDIQKDMKKQEDELKDTRDDIDDRLRSNEKKREKIQELQREIEKNEERNREDRQKVTELERAIAELRKRLGDVSRTLNSRL